jgi:FkbM family methyltransferase
VIRDLIYDVGMGNGDDSAYYLSKGFRVVAIEANPSLAERARERFAPQIATGRMVILNVGVREDEGEAEFWICDDQSDWSSFNRALAARAGSPHHAVTVRCRDFGTVLEEYGIPFYCKIDIEGADRLCLRRLLATGARPEFLSIEMCHERGDEDLGTLHELGYNGFKIIDQLRRCTPSERLYRVLSHFGLGGRVFFELINRGVRGRRRDGSWRFPVGSSGPFGEATPGRWLQYDDALRVWRYLHEEGEGAGRGIWAEWFDIHATARA